MVLVAVEAVLLRLVVSGQLALHMGKVAQVAQVLTGSHSELLTLEVAALVRMPLDFRGVLVGLVEEDKALELKETQYQERLILAEVAVAARLVAVERKDMARQVVQEL